LTKKTPFDLAELLQRLPLDLGEAATHLLDPQLGRFAHDWGTRH
jgi:hypothetical protein